MTKRVLVTGKNGQLGQSLQKLVSDSVSGQGVTAGMTFTFVGRDELDLSSSDSIADYFVDKPFDAIVNCAAYTAVDKAESEPDLAYQINNLAVKQLAEIAKQRKIPLIHISTDYVFNGEGFKPYVETDATDPQNVYGLTKLKGEQAILATGCVGVIIRTSWVYSEFGNNFVKTMLSLGKERDSLNVIYDQVGSPTYVTDLAEAILEVLNAEFLMVNEEKTDSIQNSRLKIYHYSNEGVCSWFDFAKAVFESSGVNCQVNPIETKDYPTPAKRPHYSLMNKAHIKQDQPGLVVPYWRDSLQVCLKELEIKQ
ncbi:MAG: dTDP-4-dehydrorhamnose reductase [Shewanella sp. CG18_big_fil_WC_8_21_14_2_50_42_11]|uniref:dTDP-4-dehydrorhamnose reductase n=1 Tax=Shewanella TaxID=22 RepID=UPI000C5A04C9|nr:MULTISPECIES: dTDP-4-dehydrorhamnose reductase [Shewanella]NCO69858.1 dTDP-4-dehydrorhamnose reductase [Shewanella vesiculosa]PIP98685.1 MAG: dTDP-4-dehydrorhamnose reductase [Shewanella sp. CG18_big_fil_WC_8_21_14_2_50_42_11]